jgi:hypothetical protein
MTILKSIITAFFLSTCLIGQSQDTTGLKLVTCDTLQLSLVVPKVLAFKTTDVTFLMDYEKGKQLLAKQAKYGLLKELAKRQLDSVEAQIQRSDTAFLDNSVFSKWQWTPFDQLICELLNSKACIIKDQEGRLHDKIIRIHGYIWPDKIIVWSGWRYFLFGDFKYFFKCTESES